jgi:apolipoprotein N-acyltransferase
MYGYGYKNLDSFLVSSYFAWGLTIFIRILGWVDNNILYLFSIMMAVAIFLKFRQKGV